MSVRSNSNCRRPPVEDPRAGETELSAAMTADETNENCFAKWQKVHESNRLPCLRGTQTPFSGAQYFTFTRDDGLLKMKSAWQVSIDLSAACLQSLVNNCSQGKCEWTDFTTTPHVLWMRRDVTRFSPKTSHLLIKGGSESQSMTPSREDRGWFELINMTKLFNICRVKWEHPYRRRATQKLLRSSSR